MPHLAPRVRVLCVDVDVEPDVARPTEPSAQPSFDDWVAARGPSLLRFAYVVTGSQHAAEDAVQDALARACERWSRVGRTRDPDSYVRRMVVNAHISRWRRTRRESPVEVVRAGDLQPDHADALGTGAAVWAVCRELPPRQRAAVVLRFYEDLDYAEIATLLGCSEATARSHVHRALGALRSRLTEEDQ
jgi:RNA polymerase sigma-70 factor (sigma-E family)